MKKYSTLIACVLTLGVYTAEGVVYTAKNSAELNNHLNNCTIAVAEFYSPTCSHCINFNKSGTFETIAARNPDVRCIQVNYHNAAPLFGEYRVNAFPTFLVFKNGQEQKELRQAGGLSQVTLQEKINRARK